jgi:Nicotinic acid mononucleotide adenylyltransferase
MKDCIIRVKVINGGDSMPEKMLNELYKELVSRLTDRQLLKTIKLSKKTMLELIRPDECKACMKAIAGKGRVSCGDVLKLCEPLLSYFCEMPPVGWLQSFYDYTLEQLFPRQNEAEPEKAWDSSRLLYFEVLRFFLQHEIETVGFDPKCHMGVLSEEEYCHTETASEYRRLLNIINNQYLYEFMRIGTEVTRHKTLAHIAGVHYISLHVGRQLLAAGIPIDIALISGAAFGHDIGKYGCKPEESRRIPYLHYYYTDSYFKRNHMPVIGHIAANHSTWDLELENLSVESLVLIYADFRVKNEKDASGQENVSFFSLEDSFQVILDKLDNVDEAKRNRYDRVYAKLKDFEDYMEGLGINTDLTRIDLIAPEKKDASLLSPQEAIRSLKHLAIRHNILVMHKFNGDTSFRDLIEAAKSEKNWKDVRAYINIFQEYCTYMTQKQKIMTLNFLYELLMNREGDIRRQSANLLGNIIVHYDVEYRKELPAGVYREKDEITSLTLWEKYLELIIRPDHRVTEQHRRWLGYALKLVVASVLEHCKPEDVKKYLDIFLNYYHDDEQCDSTAFILLDSIHSLPLPQCAEEDKLILLQFTSAMARKDSLEVQIAALRFLHHLSEDAESRENCRTMILDCLDCIDTRGEISLEYLIYKILSNLGLDDKGEMKKNFESCLSKKPGAASEIFLDNLKAATPWILKITNLDLLLFQTATGTGSQILQAAAHLSNLVKVSERVAVRHRAGEGLLSIIPLLPLDQRNEIAVELCKGLEIGEYEFSKYIPDYLGELALYLHPNELDELISDLGKMLYSANDRICSVTLNTLGVMLQHYAPYAERFKEGESAGQKRRKSILGLILKGLSDYHEPVSQEAFLVIGQHLFGSGALNLEEKNKLFTIIYKKMLTLITDRQETELSFFNSAASLNHIYRFILDYIFYNKKFELPFSKNIAFFPGSFDPFSLGHKGIVSEIRDLGFDVYLSLDEFFWSKKTQPKLIRRQIINMSVADEINVYLFPDEIPVNIGNPSDLKRLRELFSDRNIYIVAGSDVIEHASSYHAPWEENSIYSFPHIIVNRSNPDTTDSDDPNPASSKKLSEATAEKQKYPMITGEIKRFNLPPQLEEISSSKVRENIDCNRDISNLVDPLVQSYIYDNSLYLREPLFKHIFSVKPIRFDLVERFDEKLAQELEETIFRHHDEKSRIREYLMRRGTNAVIIRDGNRNDIPVGIATFHEIGMADLYDEFGSLKLASCFRGIISGKITVLSGIAAVTNTSLKNIEQLAITEVLAHCLKNDFIYAIFHNHIGETDDKLVDLMERQGFLPIFKNEADSDPIYGVDMKFPVTFSCDIETMVKEPFNKRLRVLTVIEEAHHRIQRNLAKLYPGNLIMTFDSEIMNHRIVDMIAGENRINGELTADRELGQYMCVPFGKILRGMAVPNIITKSLHTEKKFEPGVERFQITEFPYYSSLLTQIRTIKSFRKPVLLVDDLLHKGYRVKELDPILKIEQVEVSKIIVGILSGRGKDLMTLQGRQVDSVYFIPNLRSWFVESSLYPFLGGEGITRRGKGKGGVVSAGLIPSVNLILPYIAPGFMVDLPKTALYEFSLSCLENAKNILTALEEEYQLIYERNLTLNRLSEAVYTPRYPDKGLNMSYDLNLPPSVYVENDIELLKRLENLII